MNKDAIMAAINRLNNLQVANNKSSDEAVTAAELQEFKGFVVETLKTIAANL